MADNGTKPGVFTNKKPRTGNTKEAMQLLMSNPRTAKLIAWGCHIAVLLALKSRTVHSRAVRDEMDRRGLLTKEDKEFWLGPVFKKLKTEKILTWTGHMFTYSDEERNVHERTIKLWELNEDADLTVYRTPPE